MRWSSVAGVVVLALGWTTLAEAQSPQYTQDSLKTVRQKLDAQEAILLDVRSKEEWDAGHLKEAQLLPLVELQDDLSAEQVRARLPEGKIIYAHCARGPRALAAQEMLKSLGYDVRALNLGYEQLKKAGFPATKD